MGSVWRGSCLLMKMIRCSQNIRSVSKGIRNTSTRVSIICIKNNPDRIFVRGVGWVGKDDKL